MDERYSQFIPSERIIHSFKTALACLIGLVIVKLTSLTQWVLITILVVMCAQQNVGSMLQKSYMRFLGTILGAAAAIACLFFFDNNIIASGFTLLLSIFIFSYLATSDKSYSDAATLGAATVVIIIIAPHPTIFSAFERCFEISLGVLIASLISQFIFPIHAKTHLRNNQSHTIRQLFNSYQKTFVDNKIETLEQHILFDEMISKSITVQRKLANDAKRELFGQTFSVNHFKECLWCEKEILRAMNLMYHTYHASLEAHKVILRIPAVREFHLNICKALEKIARNIVSSKPETITIPTIIPTQTAIRHSIENMSANEKKDILTFLFAMEVLILRLTKLSILLQDIH